MCTEGSQEVIDALQGSKPDSIVIMQRESPKESTGLSLHNCVGRVCSHSPQDVVDAPQGSDVSCAICMTCETAKKCRRLSLHHSVSGVRPHSPQDNFDTLIDGKASAGMLGKTPENSESQFLHSCLGVHPHCRQHRIDATEGSNCERVVGMLCETSKSSTSFLLHHCVRRVCPHHCQDVTYAH
mmetsp:Transcript_109333/g.265731  ORF Transcript_109333/g.265731 Transcript_109333/m.265731 type:complete len:183 (+) Transcript_109333:536-1084(+)